MRKIKVRTKEARENKTRRNAAIVCLVLLALSTVGFAVVNSFSNSGSSFGGSSEGFSREGNYWTLDVAGQKYYFSYLPSQVANISISGNFSLGDYYSKPLYFVNDDGASYEILNNLANYLQRWQEACVEDEACSNDELPVKNCSVDNIIIFKEGKDSVSKNDNCVYISGDSLKGADRFVYEVLKIN